MPPAKKHKFNHFDTIVVSIVAAVILGSAAGYLSAESRFKNASRVPGSTSNILIRNSEEEAVIELIKDASPAVVSIVATQDLRVINLRSSTGGLCDDPFIRSFYPEMCRLDQLVPDSIERRQVSAGTGFIVSSDGMIVTNRHVVDIQGDTEYTVVLKDGEQLEARVVAIDPIQDIAILDVDKRGLPILKLGDSNTIEVGQTVLAIGNALGRFSNTVSKGIVSGLSRSIVASNEQGIIDRLDEVIQTDAAINPGNSGGPLLNLAGEVIGVNTAIVTGAENIGFTIPVNLIKRDILQVEQEGRIFYPFLGVSYSMITKELQDELGLSVDFGALIIPGDISGSAVVSDSPADKAGIEGGDIILEINGKILSIDNDLSRIIQSRDVGDVISILILRDGKEITLKARLAERE